MENLYCFKSNLYISILNFKLINILLILSIFYSYICLLFVYCFYVCLFLWFHLENLYSLKSNLYTTILNFKAYNKVTVCLVFMAAIIWKIYNKRWRPHLACYVVFIYLHRCLSLTNYRNYSPSHDCNCFIDFLREWFNSFCKDAFAYYTHVSAIYKFEWLFQYQV